MKYHDEVRKEAVRQVQEDKNNIRRVAKSITADVMEFWEQIAELVKIKHTSVVEAKRKQALNKYEFSASTQS